MQTATNAQIRNQRWAAAHIKAWRATLAYVNNVTNSCLSIPIVFVFVHANRSRWSTHSVIRSFKLMQLCSKWKGSNVVRSPLSLSLSWHMLCVFVLTAQCLMDEMCSCARVYVRVRARVYVCVCFFADDRCSWLLFSSIRISAREILDMVSAVFMKQCKLADNTALDPCLTP